MSTSKLVTYAIVAGVCVWISPLPASIDLSGLYTSLARRFKLSLPNIVKGEQVENGAKSYLQSNDDELDDVTYQLPDPIIPNTLVRKPRQQHKARYCRMVADELKLKFPYVGLKRTTSDYLAVHHGAVAIMTDHKVVKSHISKLVPLIVAMVFVPSESELEGKLWSQTRDVEDFTNAYATTSVDHWSDWWFGIGRRTTFTRT
jgi:hypothetical protein